MKGFEKVSNEIDLKQNPQNVQWHCGNRSRDLEIFTEWYYVIYLDPDLFQVFIVSWTENYTP